MIQEAYEKAKGAPFWIQAPENRYLVVSSWSHIKEIDAAPEDVLSLQAAAKEILQPRYTMQNFNWFDKKGVDGTPLARTLRTLLTNHLPDILPDIRRSMSVLLDDVQDSQPMVNGRDERFMAAAMSFIEHTLICAEVVRVLPRAITPFIGNLIAKNLGSGKTIYDSLIPIAEERLEERAQKSLGHAVPEHTACFALHHLCLHPEYVEPLRSEIESTGWAQFEKLGGKAFPLLDSFMKESARISPVESVSSRRMALKPFVLSDGSRVETGEWICTAARGMMLDARHYTAPLEFQGFRFVEPSVLQKTFPETTGEKVSQLQGTPSNFTDIGDWQLWGTGRSACPGRFYATAVMKTLLALFITKYDMQLEDPKSRYFAWRTFIYPYSSTKVIVHHRTAL
ncbi:hypothetical protein ACHAQJ_001904 [Trichoderma viride]